MILPVGDTAARRVTPIFNWLLIAANVVVFGLYAFKENPREVQAVFDAYALVPLRWEVRTVFSSMFLHGSLDHLFGNMLFLWIVGDNVEGRLGHAAYLVFYLAAGAAGAAAHIVYCLTLAGSAAAIPTVGASGAISGVIGAFLAFFPRSEIKFMLWLIVFVRTFKLPTWGAVGLWAGMQVLMARNQLDGLAGGETMRVAVFAHLGGFGFGLVAAFLLRVLAPPPRQKE